MSLEELRELEKHIQLAISIQETPNAMRPTSYEDKRGYNEKYWMFDAVIGDFGIRRIRNRLDEY